MDCNSGYDQAPIIFKSILGMPLIVKPVSANLTHDTEFIQRMDPYVKMYMGGQQKRSQMCKDGGKHPFWNDTFFFNQTNDNLLKIQVWDDDTFKDDFVGEGTYNISQLYNMPNMRTQNEWVDLYYQGRGAGRILISVELQNGGMGMGMGMGMNNQWGANNMNGGYNNGGWGQGQMNGGYGMPPPNNGWGMGPPPNNGWGMGPPPNNGWGMGPPPNNGWGNGGWGNNGW